MSAGVSVAPAVGAATSGVSPWVTQTEKVPHRRRADFPGPGPPSWPIPRR